MEDIWREVDVGRDGGGGVWIVVFVEILRYEMELVWNLDLCFGFYGFGGCL